MLRVEFYALLRPLSKTGAAEFDLPGATLAALLQAIIQQFPEMRPHLLDESENLRREVPIFVNGRNPRLFPDGADQLLPEDCVVSIFSPIASGRMNVEVLRPSLFDPKLENEGR